MSFRQLFDDLAQFVEDPEYRFRMCVRVKRGCADSGLPGAFCKDQIYLQGALDLLRHRKTIDFRALYVGKIDYRDLELCKGVGTFEGLLLPQFMADMDRYHSSLDKLLVSNGLSDWLLNQANEPQMILQV